MNYSRLLPRFVALGFEVHLLAFYYEDYPTARALEAQGIKVHPQQVTSLFTKDITVWILEQAEQIQPDVFIPDVSTPGCFAGKWLKDSGVPVINSCRSLDDTNRGRALYFSDPRSPYVSTGIVCVSQYLRDDLLSRVDNPALLTTVIPSGVELSTYVSQQKAVPFCVAYAGRLVEKAKRITDTIEAFATLGRKYPDIHFTLIGDGPERSRCQGLVEQAGMQERIRITGFLVGEAYKRELARHNVIVLLSDYEGVPGAIMDGMSCGLVPICTEYDGVQELITDGENGYIVRDRGPMFFQAVESLYSNAELRQRLSHNARERIIHNFSLDIAVERWQSFFAECQKVAGARKTFQRPRLVKLPELSPLLTEYTIRSPKPSYLRRIFRKFVSIASINTRKRI